MADDASCVGGGNYQKPTKHRMVIVGVLFVTLVIAYLDRVNVSVMVADNVFLTEMGIKGNPVQMGMLMTTFLAAYGVANIILSPLGDILGPRKAMMISIALWGLSLFGGGLTATFTMMLAMRVILGVGEGLHWPMQSKFVKNWFPPEERGRANAIWLMGLKIGPALAMPFFAWVIYATGWRNSFFIMSVLSLVPLLALWFLTTDHPHQNKAVNRAELEYIQTGLKAEAEREAKIAKSTVWENMKVFIFNYRYWILIIYYGCSACIFWGIMSWLPSYLKAARGFSWAAMGAWSSVSYILATLSVLFAGFLSDKVGRRAPFNVLAMLCAAAGIYFGAYATDNLTAVILISLANASLGFGTPTAWAILQQIVPSRAIGAGAGVMNGFSNGSAAFSPVIIGFFITVTGGYAGGLMFLVTMALIGAACASVLALQKY